MFVIDLLVCVRRSSRCFPLGHMISFIRARKIQPAMLKWIRVFSGVWDLISINKLFSVCSAIISILIHFLCNRPHRRGSCRVHRNGIQQHRCTNHRSTHRNRWWVNSVLRTRRPVEQLNDLSPMSAIAPRVRRNRRFPFHDFSFLVFEVNRSFNSQQQVPTKLEFSTPVRSMTPDLYNRVPSSSIKRSRMTPALATTTSTYETPPPAAPLPSIASNMDSAEWVSHVSLFFKFHSFSIV